MHDDELRRRADLHGVSPGYHDAYGQWRDSPVETLRAVLAAMGIDPADEPSAAPRALVVRPGAPVAVPDGVRGATVALEDGGEAALPDVLPGPLPPGYHALVGPHGRTPLLVVPDRAHLPERLAQGGRMWGVAVQLYAVHGATSWGIGDLADLARLPAALGEPDFLLLNPLHAPAPTAYQQPSPYYAATRRFRNPLAIAIEAIPEATRLAPGERAQLDRLAARGRALTGGERIDRDAIWALKRDALSLLHATIGRDPSRRAALDRFRARDPEIDRFATWCVLAETFPGDWRGWPDDLRDPAGAGVARRAAADPGRVDLFAYMQLLLDEQLAAVPPLGLGVMTDLAVGAARDGYEAWAHQGVVVDGMKVGAPPDLLGPFGQDWGLPPLSPGGLAAAGYEPLAGIVRAAMEHAGGLRIDHVMGLSRLFWIPDGATPADGAYVRYPVDDLLGVVALESQRARCLVVGEDLGVVEPALRDALAARDILSYRLAWFEERPAAEFPRVAMAAVTTHDLPTVAGFMSGGDLAHLREIGVLDDETAARFGEREQGERQRLRERLASESIDGAWSDDPRDVARALHAFVGRTPCMLACASLDDAVGAAQRPNVPGTIDQHPNWRLPLPVSLEQIAADPIVRASLAPLAARAAG